MKDCRKYFASQKFKQDAKLLRNKKVMEKFCCVSSGTHHSLEKKLV